MHPFLALPLSRVAFLITFHNYQLINRFWGRERVFLITARGPFFYLFSISSIYFRIWYRDPFSFIIIPSFR